MGINSAKNKKADFDDFTVYSYVSEGGDSEYEIGFGYFLLHDPQPPPLPFGLPK